MADLTDEQAETAAHMLREFTAVHPVDGPKLAFFTALFAAIARNPPTLPE
jgi:hypothetical protein